MPGQRNSLAAATEAMTVLVVGGHVLSGYQKCSSSIWYQKLLFFPIPGKFVILLDFTKDVFLSPTDFF